MAPDDYQKHTELNIVQHLSSVTLSHLAYDEKGAHLCLCAKLLWEHTGYKDFDGIKRIFSLAMKECLATLKNRQIAYKEKRTQVAIERWSRNSYISSSFGRTDSADQDLGDGEDPISALNYISSITLPVAETISNPESLWKASGRSNREHRVLDHSQRRYAPHLIHRATTVYAQVKAQLSVRQLSVLEICYLAELETRQVFIEVYTTLEDWPAVSHLIQETLQREDIVKFCKRKPWEPWESNPSASKGAQPSGPPHHDTGVNKPSVRTGW